LKPTLSPSRPASKNAFAAQRSDGREINNIQTALKNDALYVPGEICYAGDPARRKPNHEMRISFGNASETDISVGIKRLGKVLKKFRGLSNL
jgi:DNA-binding transcriptional MocR family regulator